MTEEIKDKDLEKAAGGLLSPAERNGKRHEKAVNCPNYEAAPLLATAVYIALNFAPTHRER